MVIHHDDLPFEVCFLLTQFSGQECIKVEFFTDDENENLPLINDILELTETSVILRSKDENDLSQEGSLYIDGIDALDNVSISEGEAFIPCGTKVTVYIQRNGDRSYPWIPGTYRIVVVWDDKNYYSYINITPRHVGEDELEVIRNDIETISSGLAREIVFRRKGILYDDKEANLPPLLIDKYYFIKERFSKLKFIINDIVNLPINDVVKYYELTPAYKSKKIDDKTNKWILSHKGRQYNAGVDKNPRVLLCPKAVLETDILVNQWVKHIVVIIKNSLMKNLKTLESYKAYYQEEIDTIKEFSDVSLQGAAALLKNRENALLEIEKIAQNSIMYVNYFNSILNSSFFKEISSPNNTKIPLILMKEGRYRFLYNIYRAFTDNLHVVQKGVYEFQWKATDKLYEYWCYIKLAAILIEMGYSPNINWILDRTVGTRDLTVYLKDGTSLELEKDDVRLLLIYNKEVLMDKTKAIKDGENIWSRMGNNKPDIRIDVLKYGKYSHSIVLDAKYRNPKSVWDKAKTKKHKRPHVMIQLSNYKIAFENPLFPDQAVVKRVFALCPKLVKDMHYEEDDDHGITIATIKPNVSYNHIKELISKYL